jgi:hypothetical protein
MLSGKLASGAATRYGPPMAWPERIILIAVTAFAVLAAEIAIIVAAREIRVSGWLMVVFALAAVFGDIWAVLRTIDWLFAGPARRAGYRVIGPLP